MKDIKDFILDDNKKKKIIIININIKFNLISFHFFIKERK